MKTNKRTLAMLTAGLLALTPCFTAGMLTAEAATITVNKATGDTAAHTYKAYPIITGTLATDGTTLTGMTWATGIDRSALATALKSFNSTAFASFTATTTPEEFVTMLEGVSDYEGLAKVFNASGVITGSGTALSDNSVADDPYTATVTNDGWYLIRDESATGQLKSANILEVKGTTAITPKFSLPTLEKKITDSDGSNPVDANTAAIGDTVYYKISTNVPDVTGYDKYYFIVDDVLSAGLTYNENSIVVKIGDTQLTKDTDGPEDGATGNYYVTTTGSTSIKVVFEDFLNYIKTNNIAKDTAITITYNATLNSNASIDPNAGNPNTAKLTYSNNPNYEGDGSISGKPDEPTPPTGDTPSDIVGETAEDKVNTYTTAIKIKKVDQDNQPLTGATFTLTGTALNKVSKVSGSTFTIDDENGTYYKLTTGAYTTTPPTDPSLSDAAKAKYSNDGHTYSKVAATPSDLTASSTSISSTVDEEGYITFYGLNAGTYTLEETVVPDGYNKADNVGFTLAADTKDENSATWTNSNTDFSKEDNVYTIQIQNRKGSILPSTGGIGTKLFYLFGGMLVVGSSVVLITKKRMSAEEK